MSELKAYNTKYEQVLDEVYLKSEADKVIAALKESVKNLILDNYLKDKEIRLQKYKRCLAMAERCKDKIENVVQYNEHDDWLIINESSLFFSLWVVLPSANTKEPIFSCFS